MLTWDQLEYAIQMACRRFSGVLERYPELRPYLVLCRQGAQARLPSMPSSLLRDCPSMVVDDAAKAMAISIMRQGDVTNKAASSAGGARAMLEKSLDTVCCALHYHDDILVEVRFSELVFESIWRMQADVLVERTLTPQTKASIRIVLGPLAALVSDGAAPGSDRAQTLNAATKNTPIDVSEESDSDCQDDRETQGGRRTP